MDVFMCVYFSVCLCVCVHVFVCVLGDFLSDSHLFEDLVDINGLKKVKENTGGGLQPDTMTLGHILHDAIEHSVFKNTTHTSTRTLIHV